MRRRGSIPPTTSIASRCAAWTASRTVVAAARQAEADSGIDVAAYPERMGVSVGTGIGGLQSFQDCYDDLLERGPDRVNPFSIPEMHPEHGRGLGLDELGTRGPLATRVHRLCGVQHGDRRRARRDRLGRADVMIPVERRRRSQRSAWPGSPPCERCRGETHDPERASRPFDADRDGFVMGEAGAVLVLEDLERASSRGAKDLRGAARVRRASGCAHVTRPIRREKTRRGRWGWRSQMPARAEEIGYINAHGTSTPLGAPPRPA